MGKSDGIEPAVVETMRRIQRTWLIWGVLPLVVAAMLMVAVSAVWASPANADEHVLERGFQAVLAVCAGLFLTGFWLDGRWTNSERVAALIRRAAVGDGDFEPTRSQLASQAKVAFKSVSTSATALTVIGGAIAVAAVVSAWAGLGLSEGVQIVLLGLFYQVFTFSRHPYYEELLSAAARGELVVPESDNHHTRGR